MYADSISVVCILFWPDGVRFLKNRYFLGVSWEWLLMWRCIIIILNYKKDLKYCIVWIRVLKNELDTCTQDF